VYVVDDDVPTLRLGAVGVVSFELDKRLAATVAVAVVDLVEGPSAAATLTASLCKSAVSKS
jgi:hypothetical protein